MSTALGQRRAETRASTARGDILNRCIGRAERLYRAGELGSRR